MDRLIELALSVTTLVSIIRSVVDGTKTLPSVLWPVIALIIGVVICWGGGIDLLVGTRLSGTGGQILSGIAVGALAGFGHELLDALRGVAGKGPLHRA